MSSSPFNPLEPAPYAPVKPELKSVQQHRKRVASFSRLARDTRRESRNALRPICGYLVSSWICTASATLFRSHSATIALRYLPLPCTG
jgi:hypothetical protein